MLAALLYAAISICHDKSADCHAWSVDGQCGANSEYMHYTCPLSCGVSCGHPALKPPRTPQLDTASGRLS